METKLALKEQVRRLRDERGDWYLRGVTDALALVEAHGLKEALELINRSRSWTTHANGTETHHPASPYDQIANAETYAKLARAELKQRAEDKALVERITPLLEERFQKKARRG